jgi:SHS2 domain-containing protein
MTFERFEHRADVGVRGRGETLEEAFEEGARAMFSVMADLKAVQPLETFEVEVSASDEEALFVEWLNELLSIADLNGIVFCDFEVEISGNNLKGRASGEKWDLEKHEPKTEVKAATYSQLQVKKENGSYVAQCIVDV